MGGTNKEYYGIFQSGILINLCMNVNTILATLRQYYCKHGIVLCGAEYKEK